jgi:hypothetical protein
MATKQDAYKTFYDVKRSLKAEAVGDNKVDNMIEETRRSVEVEISMFVLALLNTSLKAFAQQYRTPQHEGFRGAMQDLYERYRVMDGTERADLFEKIELMFKGIFQDNYDSLGPDAAELVAKRYAKQMCDMIKAENRDPMASTELLYPNQTDLYPKAMPDDDLNTRQPEAPEQLKVLSKGFKNVY